MGTNPPDELLTAAKAAAKAEVEAGMPLTPEFLAWAVEGYRLAQNATEAGYVELRTYLHANPPFCARTAYCTSAEREQIIRAYHESLEQSPDAQPETQPPRD